MDSQNLFGALEFSMACKKAGIQPILGCEMMIDFNLQDSKNISNVDFTENLCKTPLIATSEEGYRNLMFLVSESYLKRQNGIAPFINFELLKQKSSGIIALSGGSEGLIGKLLLQGQDKQAHKFLLEIKEIFNTNFYIEITRHGTKNEELIEEKLLQLAFENSLPIVATNDVYFLTPEMHEAQDILSCIYEGHSLVEENRKKNSPEQYFKNYEQFLELFKDLPEAITNTINIAKKCHTMAFERPPTLPKFSTEANFD
jgi:DNA polymerase-3 subunit alpha